MNAHTKAVKVEEAADQRDWLAWLSIVMLVLSAAIVPVFIRMAQAESIPSISIIGMRLVFSTLLITPIVFRWHGDVQVAWSAEFVYFGAMALLSYQYMRSGRWKQRQV